MRSLYPEQLADRAWDNVGLLLGNIDPADKSLSGPQTKALSKTVLLTNDLSIAVAEEAVRKNASVIVSYHPFIFRGLKSITLNDPQQRILLQLVQNNIAVYCPHTAVDAVPGGLNDWLADILSAGISGSKRTVAQPTSSPPPTGFEGSGYGRMVEFGSPTSVVDLVRKAAKGLGGLGYVQIAAPKQADLRSLKVNSAAVCAGSGWDVLKDSGADLIVTGEMTHHNALKATMEGKVVVTVFHSNSERLFLKERMQPALQEKLQQSDSNIQVLVSEEDADPFEIWDVSKLD